MFFDVEVTSDDLFEAFGWVFKLADHSVSDVSKSDDVRIGFVFAISLFSALLALKARFVKVDIFTHSDSLC